MITLNYINNQTRRFQTYIANRIVEILEHTTPDQWKHCPGYLNPADDASRGLEMVQFRRSKRWLNGPAFLRNEKSPWPKVKISPVPITSLEVKKEVYVTDVTHTDSLDNLITRYSDWNKCLRGLSWLQRFITWLRHRKEVEEKVNLTLEDLENAKYAIVKLVQRQAFHNEISELKKKKCCHKI